MSEHHDAVEADQVENQEKIIFSSQNAESQEEIQLLKSRISVLEEQLAQSQDQVLRQQAEWSNTLKRKEQEKEQALRYAQSDFFKEFIFVLDSLESALFSMKQSSEGQESLITGLSLLEQQLHQLLQKFHFEVINPEIGSVFNPHYAEAMSIQSVPNQEDNTVLFVVQKGYQLQNRVLRPARVIVVKNN